MLPVRRAGFIMKQLYWLHSVVNLLHEETQFLRRSQDGSTGFLHIQMKQKHVRSGNEAVLFTQQAHTLSQVLHEYLNVTDGNVHEVYMN